ncbi:hypothetical protein GGC47_002230 [Bosea sp. OAE752]
MKNHNRMMIGMGTPTSHRMIERMDSPFWERMMLCQRLLWRESSYSPVPGGGVKASALGCQRGL